MSTLSRDKQIWWALLLLAVTFLTQQCAAIKWLGLNNYSQLTEGRLQAEFFCNRMRQLDVLNRKQFKFCKKFAVERSDAGAVSAVIKSAHITVETCQKQFRHFRWDCSVLRHVPELAPELKSLTAEQALVHALSGLVLSTTFADECSRGLIRRCGCGRQPTWLARERPQQQFHFDGCHTNLRMGQRLARKFLGASRSGGGRGRRIGRGRRRGGRGGRRGAGRRSQRREHRRRKVQLEGHGSRSDRSRGRSKFRKFVQMVNRYNYNVGIEASRLSEAVRCKCHGSSASCAIRTCHKVLHRRNYQHLEHTYIRRYNRDPLDVLLEMYDKKLRKTVYSESGYLGYEEPCSQEDRSSNPLRAEPKCENYKVVSGMPTKNDVLLFHEHSLDYCHLRDGRFPGTQNRECLPDGSPAAQRILKSATAGPKRREIVCSVMCCGRTYRNVTEQHEGTHEECQKSSCKLLTNPYRQFSRNACAIVRLCLI
uniref:Protein Wnt n=1 Tax=Macrostomum lignano TaxID=282301 RepID=A0A1I8J3J2_9PLAT